MRLQRSSRSWSIECRISAASFTLAKRFAATAASYVNSSVSALALVGAPYVLSHRRHLEIGDRVQGEVPAAPAILSHGRRADQSEHHHNEQQTAHSQNLLRSHLGRLARRKRASHSRNSRSIFCALSKFLAEPSPIGATSLADASSAARKSAPATVAPEEPEDPLDRWRRMRAEREEPEPRERKLDVVPPTLAEIDQRIEARIAAEREFMIEVMGE